VKAKIHGKGQVKGHSAAEIEAAAGVSADCGYCTLVVSEDGLKVYAEAFVVVSHVAQGDARAGVECHLDVSLLPAAKDILARYVETEAGVGTAAGGYAVNVYEGGGGVEDAVFFLEADGSADSFDGVEYADGFLGGGRHPEKAQEQQWQRNMELAEHNTKVDKTLIISNKKTIFAVTKNLNRTYGTRNQASHKQA
jgi:hypothetical protein